MDHSRPSAVVRGPAVPTSELTEPPAEARLLSARSENRLALKHLNQLLA